MNIPPEYKTDHLLVLVGTNPLPNWVAAELLLRKEGTVHLIHSGDTTARIADRLREHLPASCSLLQVNPTDASNIERQLSNRLHQLDGKIGLHYTGGTKAMAVHAYRTVEQALRGNSPEPVFSYLDADSFELWIDPNWHESVLMAVRPCLEDLAEMHGARLRKGSPQRKGNLLYPQTATALASTASKGGLKAWQQWCDTVGEQLKSSPSTLGLPDDLVLADVVVAMRRELELTKGSELPASQFKPLTKWFTGDWLEHYVLSQIIQVSEKTGVHDFGMSLATDQSMKSEADFDFEFDVAAMRGYQFFGISCTTSTNKWQAKSKLFEAYIRARQLGGDEARVGLVCGYEDAKRFESEVVQKWQAKDKIRVFGPHDLPNLAEHLTDWFMTAK
jgi:hypothetical protein